MIRWRDNHIRVRRKRHVLGVHVLRRANHDREVGEVVGELVQQFFAVMDGQVQLDVGITLGGFKAEMQQRVNERKLRLSKRLRAYVRTLRMVNEMHG